MAANLRLGHPRRVNLRRSRRIAGMAMSLAQLMDVVTRAVIEEPVACHSLVCSAEPGMRTTSPTARVRVRSSGCFPRDWDSTVGNQGAGSIIRTKLVSINALVLWHFQQCSARQGRERGEKADSLNRSPSLMATIDTRNSSSRITKRRLMQFCK